MLHQGGDARSFFIKLNVEVYARSSLSLKLMSPGFDSRTATTTMRVEECSRF